MVASMRTILVLAIVAGGTVGCGGADDERGTADGGALPGTNGGATLTDSDGGSSSDVATGEGSATSTTAAGSTDGTSGSDAKFDLGAGEETGTGGPMTYPVRMLPGLVSITFYERTGGEAPDAFTFLLEGGELTVRLDDPLAPGNFDIDGATGEFYDVYYSDQVGAFDIDGRYLTISGTFGQALPAGGGLNLAEIGLNFDDDETEFGNYVASHVILGDNAAQPDGNVENAIDGDLQTHTTMGNTVGSNERLRVTLGFLSSSGPPG
jgi:hypothetical protein